MNIGDLISTIIALIIVAYAIVTTIYSLARTRKGEELPDWLEEEEEIEEERSKAILPPPPPLPPLVEQVRPALPPEKKFATEKFTFHAKLDDFEQKTAIEDRKLTIGLHSPDEIVSDAVRVEGQVFKREKETPIQALIKRLPHKKLLWISHEVVDKPVAFRRFPLPWNR